MKSARILVNVFCVAGVLALGACKAEVKTDSKGTDSVAVTTNPEVKDNVNDAASTVSGEAIQAKVSTALVAEPGAAFQNVDVVSDAAGMIVLNGTVADENMKAKAEMLTKNIDGVKGVTNNLTVAAK